MMKFARRTLSAFIGAVANPGADGQEPEPGDPQAAQSAEAEEPPETDAERRRRIQDALFGSDERHGFHSTWRGRPPER